MVKPFRSKKRMTRKMRRGGDSSSSKGLEMTRHASESRIFSRPASLKSVSKSKSKSKSSSKSKSKSKSKSSSKKSVSAEEYINDTCPICLDLLSLRPTITTKCHPRPHTFHEDCLIGWCGAQRGGKTCPVCRTDIASTCTEILPFNSMEIFRYFGPSGEGGENWDYKYDKTVGIITNPKFDPNVRATYFRGDPETFSFFWHLARDSNNALGARRYGISVNLLKMLLARPDLVIPASDAADYAGWDRIRKLLIEYNKVPPELKKQWK